MIHEFEELLVARGISKTFPGVKALDDVSITVHKGKVHALLGENGAGKSTFMKILSGVSQPDSGEIIFKGKPVKFHDPKQAQDAGIAIIHQELNLIPEMTVAENMFLGREPINAWGIINYRQLNLKCQAILNQLKLDVTPDELVSNLRVGQQQLVEIGKALSLNAELIIMDEPTSAITNQEVDALFTIIQELKSTGIGIIYITHKLDELPRISDELTIFRDGRYIHSTRVNQITTEEIVRMMVGRNPADLFQRSHTTTSKELLRIENLSLPHPDRPWQNLLQDISFTLNAGEVLGIFGLMGAGRTELLESIFGLHYPTATGKFFINEQAVLIDSPRTAIKHGLALAPEDRKQDGLNLYMNVNHNISMTSLEKFENWGCINDRAETSNSQEYVGRLKIKTPHLRQMVNLLSGGNQQKVVLAKWLSNRPAIIMLDEPTRGIDIGAKSEIYHLIETLAGQGIGIIMVSSEIPEIKSIADRIMVLSAGRNTGVFTKSEFKDELLMQAALPVSSRC